MAFLGANLRHAAIMHTLSYGTQKKQGVNVEQLGYQGKGREPFEEASHRSLSGNEERLRIQSHEQDANHHNRDACR